MSTICDIKKSSKNCLPVHIVSYRSPKNTSSPSSSKDRYFVPVEGGMMDPVEDADVPGGAPVIIEDIFRHAQDQVPDSEHEESEDAGLW